MLAYMEIYSYSKQAAEILSKKKNKSEYIDVLIRQDAAQEGGK